MNKITLGFKKFKDRIDEMSVLYEEVLAIATSEEYPSSVYKITDPKYLKSILEVFTPALIPSDAKYPLESIFEAAIHLPTGALMISNKGATLYCLSPRTRTPYITRHIGLSVYMPGIGLELVNIGLSGNVYSKKVVVRSESACSPSFLYGSQRCNCNHQWSELQELNSDFNPVSTPTIENGREFERWVQEQFSYDGKHHLPSVPGPGFVMMHIDTQNGMGSGYTKGEFSFDLYARASMRHRGEYSSEQIYHTSMGEGFEAIGLVPDPRKEDNGVGYKVTTAVLDYLDISKDLIFLSNNPLKVKSLEDAGYTITRIPFMGEINIAGSQEAKERHTEFGHLNISGSSVTFKEDFAKVRQAIAKLIHENAQN
jgi:GTP cyclohydrolase II